MSASDNIQASLREQRLRLRQQQLSQFRLLSLRGSESPSLGPQTDYKLRLKETPSRKSLDEEAVNEGPDPKTF